MAGQFLLFVFMHWMISTHNHQPVGGDGLIKTSASPKRKSILSPNFRNAPNCTNQASFSNNDGKNRHKISGTILNDENKEHDFTVSDNNTSARLVISNSSRLGTRRTNADHRDGQNEG